MNNQLDYLQDEEFLNKLDKTTVKIKYVNITLLDFITEKPIKDITGLVSAGNLSVNTSSSVRRTISLTFLALPDLYSIDDLDNDISINKKIKVEIGYKNTLKSYKDYGDIIWFPCGIYIISTANITFNTSGVSISITAKDKMVLLNGICGGTLPSSVSFHEAYTYLNNNDIEITYPTIYLIILEAVTEYGELAYNKVIINDLSKTATLAIKYVGSKPIYFNSDYSDYTFTSGTTGYDNEVLYNDDVGAKPTSFTYPGELVLDAGSTVDALLQLICKTLTNFEYFFDLDGNFIFLEKKNYLNTTTNLLELDVDNYLSLSSRNAAYKLMDMETVISIAKSPSYDNIKNDYIVWGERSSDKIPIRYHFVIDEKPSIDYAKKYLYVYYNIDGLIDHYEMFDNKNGEDYEYVAISSTIITDASSFYDTVTIYGTLYKRPSSNLNYYAITNTYEKNTTYYRIYKKLIGNPCNEWREELYRRALLANFEGNIDTYYDKELLSEWRDLYDNTLYNTDKASTDAQYGWNPDVFNNTKAIKYWLDFVDNGAIIEKYSVNKIGRRTKVIKSSNAKLVYANEVPDVLFIDNDETSIREIYNDLSLGADSSLDKDMQLESIILYYNSIDLKYCIIGPLDKDLFVTSGTSVSCLDEIRDALYQYLSYNTGITITCLPKYWLEPNTIMYIEDKERKILGNFLITLYSLPFDHSGTMSITLSEVLTRV